MKQFEKVIVQEKIFWIKKKSPDELFWVQEPASKIIEELEFRYLKSFFQFLTAKRKGSEDQVDPGEVSTSAAEKCWKKI